MRTRKRLVTTAGATVLGFTAMSGMAQADTGDAGLSGLTSPLTKTLGGVVKQVAPAPRTTKSSRDSGGPSLNLPVHVHVRVPSTPRTSTRSDGPARTEAARDPGDLATADVDGGVNAAPRGTQVNANVGLCASLSADCGSQPPGSNPPGQPPGQPPQNPGGNEPTVNGSFTAVGNGGSLPFTGGPIGSLAFLGAISVLTGAGAVAASRVRARRES